REGEHLWRLLLADAMARGRHGRWRELVRARHAWRAAWDLPTGEGPIRVAAGPAPDCEGADPAEARACAIHEKADALRARVGDGADAVDPLGQIDPRDCPDVRDLLP